jgi:CelD/BcsL family acetyltransferase involved in cellulose biosynthesis
MSGAAQKIESLDSLGVGTIHRFMGEMPVVETLSPEAGPWQAAIYNHYSCLEAVWRRMETEGRCLAFQTYDWVSCWYDAVRFCRQADPLIVVVAKRGGEPVWILPLCQYRDEKLRIIAFADLGVTDYAAPVMSRNAPSDRQTIRLMLKAALDALPPSDLVNFQKLAGKVGEIPNPLLLLRHIERFSAECHGIRLTEPWPTLAKKIVQRRLYNGIRTKREKLAKHGEVVIKQHSHLETLGPHMDRILAMRRERFDAIGRPDMPPFWRTFYQSLASRKGHSFNANITTMTVAGEVVAACFGIIQGKNFHVLLSTFKMGKWEAFRPGIILFDAMLTAFSEDAGTGSYFDFTVGDEEYKKKLGSESHKLYEWMAPRSLRGLLAYSVWRAKIGLRRHPRLFSIMQKHANKIRSLKNAIRPDRDQDSE